jgi:hypothetical protein
MISAPLGKHYGNIDSELVRICENSTGNENFASRPTSLSKR